MPRLFCFADVNRHFILHPGGLAKRLFSFNWTFRYFRRFTYISSSRKRTISQSFKIISITTLSSIVIVFRINNCEIGKIFFLINNLIISPPHFSIEIEIINSNIINRFYIITYREFRGLIIFLKYNLIIFYLD